jgi:hypothetical protein
LNLFRLCRPSALGSCLFGSPDIRSISVSTVVLRRRPSTPQRLRAAPVTDSSFRVSNVMMALLQDCVTRPPVSPIPRELDSGHRRSPGPKPRASCFYG